MVEASHEVTPPQKGKYDGGWLFGWRGVVDPNGWTEWQEKSVDVLYYAEYENGGSVQRLQRERTGKSYHVLKGLKESSKFIYGNSWFPETGVPYRVDCLINFMCLVGFLTMF